MDTDESCSRCLLENSHRQRNIAHFHQNTCTFWNSCEKIISILPSIAIWKFKHLINGEKKSNALYGWLIYAEKCCLSLNSWIAGQTGLCNFSFVSEHSVQMWLNRYVQVRFLSDKSQADFSSCCLSWIKLIQAWEVTPALINCIKLGVLEQGEKGSDEWFWPIFFNFLPLGMISTLLKFAFCICSCTFLHRFWGLFMYFREIIL